MALNPLDRIHAMSRQRLATNLDPEEMETWEESDGYSIPGPRDANEDIGPTPVSGVPNAIDRYGDAMRKKAAYEGSRPRESDFKPNVLQRVLAGAANFGAGYVNAGGRVRVDPRATAQLTGSLMRPGYSRAMGEWQDQGIPVAAEMEQAGNEYKIGEAQRKAQNENERTTAYGKAQGASESLNRRREAKLDEDPWHISPTGRKMYRTGSGEVKEIEPPKAPPPVKETPTEKTLRLAKEAREVMGYAEGTDEFKAYVGDKVALARINAKLRPPKAAKTDKPRIGTVTQFSGVERGKQSALRAAESAHIKRTRGAKDPMPEAESLAILEAEKSRIMDGYDAGVETLGGNVAPRGPRPVSPAPTPAQPPKTATNPKTGEKLRFDEAKKQWVPL